MKKKYIFFNHETYHCFCRIARKLKKLESTDFVDAESFKARDKVMRIFAAECYELAEKAAKGKKPKIALQYTKLAAKLLNLSLRPKKLSDLEQIKKAIAKLKVQEKQRNVGK